MSINCVLVCSICNEITKEYKQKILCDKCKFDKKQYKISIDPDYVNKSKNRALKSTYGINLSDYNTMLEKQANKCGICNLIMNNPFVDHCHITGKVRELLCNACNSGIGFFKDNIDYLNKAIKYLERNK